MLLIGDFFFCQNHYLVLYFSSHLCICMYLFWSRKGCIWGLMCRGKSSKCQIRESGNTKSFHFTS